MEKKRLRLYCMGSKDVYFPDGVDIRIGYGSFALGINTKAGVREDHTWLSIRIMLITHHLIFIIG